MVTCSNAMFCSIELNACSIWFPANGEFEKIQNPAASEFA
jgi:hypothetical protein